jgi:hypothetical protein
MIEPATAERAINGYGSETFRVLHKNESGFTQAMRSALARQSGSRSEQRGAVSHHPVALRGVDCIRNFLRLNHAALGVVLA